MAAFYIRTCQTTFLPNNKVNIGLICGIAHLNILIITREIWANVEVNAIIIFCRTVVILIFSKNLVKHVCVSLLTHNVDVSRQSSRLTVMTYNRMIHQQRLCSSGHHIAYGIKTSGLFVANSHDEWLCRIM